MSDNYYSSQEFRDVLKRYEESHRKGETCFLSSDDFADIAEYYQLRDGSLERAQTVLDEAIAIYPDATAPLVMKARFALMKENDTKQARKWLGAVSDTSDPEYCCTMAEILIIDRKDDEADEYLHHKMEKMDEDDQQDLILDAAILFCDYGMFQKADEWLRLSDDTDHTDYKETKARILIANKKNKEGEKILNRLLDKNPFDTNCWNSLALSQFESGDFSESINSCDFALAINGNDEEALLCKANGLYNLENYEEAANYYHRYSILRPNESSPLFFQGLCMMSIHHFTEAKKILKQAEAVATKNGDDLLGIFQELAFTESRLGHVDEAQAYIDKADSLDCDHNEMDVMRGYIYLENQRMDEAHFCFSQAASNSDNDPNIYLKIAISFFDNNYLQMAGLVFQQLMKMVPKGWDKGYSYMAACAYEQHKDEEWIRYLRIAVECNPEEARSVLATYFPEGMPPEEYLDYAQGIES